MLSWLSEVIMKEVKIVLLLTIIKALLHALMIITFIATRSKVL